MRIVEPCATILHKDEGHRMLARIELAGRICYKSEALVTETSAKKFIAMLIQKGHESVLEHESVSVKFVVDRGVSHEIVRHRIASYSQESTRYCNYGKSGEIAVICPFDIASDEYDPWVDSCVMAEEAYLKLIKLGVKPQIARSVLPTCLKTELIMTANLREWRHFFRLRTSKAAHPQMRQITIPLLVSFKDYLPSVFDDILVEE
jgi:thymidylate synthase (FAD)